MPGLEASDSEPEGLRALPESDHEADEIEDRFPYLREKRKELRATPYEEAGSPQGSAGDHDLVSALKMATVIGNCVDLIEKITSHLAAEDQQYFQRTGFLQVRLGEPTNISTYNKPARKKDGDNNLRFADCPPEILKGLRRSRATE